LTAADFQKVVCWSCGSSIAGWDRPTGWPVERFKAAPSRSKLRRLMPFYDAAPSWSRLERIIARVEAGPREPTPGISSSTSRPAEGPLRASSTALAAKRKTTSLIEPVDSSGEMDSQEVSGSFVVAMARNCLSLWKKFSLRWRA
jgi:hypothetical protein